MHNTSRMHLKNTTNLHAIGQANKFIGIILDWDYNKCHVHLSMPNYVKKALKQFQHKAGKLQHAPYQSTPIQFDAKKQYTTK
jgi:hypothetical protein